ncbi:MAG TPA: hypothetical protein VFI65_34240 [Streptosporangiaceae bacterium]|nr:hypothetical protein [Streptosporangiaceae bacterium]
MSQTEPEAADQVLQWITLLQGHVDEYGGLLSLTDFDGFQAQLQEIAGVLRDQPDQAAECQTNLIELVSRYPSVGQWLVGVDPGYRDLPGVNEPLAVEPEVNAAAPEVTPAEPTVPEPVVAGPVVAAPATAEPAAAAPAVTTSSKPVVEVAADPAPAAVGVAIAEAPVMQATPIRASAPAAVKAPRSWTPDVVMQAGKEVITAIIALVIIGSTIALVARSFGLIGNASHINQAKDLIGIMLGLVGTVIGYYFGRVPAEARATSATARADQAIAEKERVKAKARSLSDNLDGIMAPASMNMLTGPGNLATHQARLQTVRDNLRDLGSS